MQDLPHRYSVTAAATTDGDVRLGSDGISDLLSAPPREFGGPGDKWSPETLLVGAVADCFVLSFRAIARASKLPWDALNCEVEGTLDKTEGVMRFTSFDVKATLEVPAEVNEDLARRILAKAERSCLITNSLSGETHLDATVVRA
ncbi:MAG: OsmC family protein [Gammaproteobacteria bacterium]|nr:OsmC family protein [Gammaproteobacteria bacterium]MDH5276104.1 OsmC family protein [Gammaproteobacteria bacterium]